MSTLPALLRSEMLAKMRRHGVGHDVLLHNWQFWARPDQLMPAGDWFTWLVLAGRGWGKTRTGAEAVRAAVADGYKRIALIAPTAALARDVMVEGQSGIMALGPPSNRPTYEPSKRRLTWPNGALATVYSADKPDRLRGPQHDFAWADELASWQHPTEAWDMLNYGLRLSQHPRIIATTTPRPIRLVRNLISDSRTVVTRGSTYDNAMNLPANYIAEIQRKYEGTRLGRQEIFAEVLADTPGALWNFVLIEACKVDPLKSDLPDMQRIVVAIDPAVSAREDSDETGIVVAGLGVDGHGYVLADLSCRLSPDAWARRAINAYREWQADRIVAEVNNGGDLVESVIRTIDSLVAYRAVHASRGKRMRAEPIAALYEQGRVHHMAGLEALEDQMVSYAPDSYDGSPDRLDALVWALHELFLEPEMDRIVTFEDRVQISPY